MPNLEKTVSDYMYDKTYNDPDVARKRLLQAYKAYAFKLRYFPDKNLPKSRQYLGRISMDHIIRAYDHPEQSALTSLFMPNEINKAFGLHDLCAEQFAAYIGGAWSTKAYVEIAERAGIAETFCSYHKVLMGAAVQGILPKPKVIVNTSLACDANNLSFRAISNLYGVPQYYVDVPYTQSPAAVEYVADQLRKLVPWLEEHTGRKFDEQAFHEAILNSKHTIENMQEVLRLKKDHYLPTTLTCELYETLALHGGLGSKESLRYSEKLLHDYRHAEARPGKRILWMHTNPFGQNCVKELFNESEKYQLIAGDINFDSLVDMDPDHPFESMARRLVYDIINGPVTNRINGVRKTADALDIDGIICFCHWGCKETCGASSLIKEQLEQAGYPTLILNGDGVDPSNRNDGQTQTRVEAFLEMLERD